MEWNASLLLAVLFATVFVCVLFFGKLRRNPPDVIHDDRGIDDVAGVGPIANETIRRRKLRTDGPETTRPMAEAQN